MESQVSLEIDYIFLGAGPGAFQSCLEFKKLGLNNYIMLEKGTDAGEFFKEHPRHRTLISINRPNTGQKDSEARYRYDWNSLMGDDVRRFTDYDMKYFPDADKLVEYMIDLQKDHNLNIQFNTEITNVKYEEAGTYMLTDTNMKKYRCKYLVIATGWNHENIPDYIKNCPGTQTYGTHDLNKQRYKDKQVLIIGKGNSAFETADYLLDVTGQIHVVSPNPIQLSWFTRYVGSLRAVNNNFLDTYLLKAGNNSINSQILNITKRDNGYEVDISFNCNLDKPPTTCTYDEVISCAGFVLDTTIFDEAIKPDLCSKKKFPLMHGNFEHKKSPNLYYCGTLTHILDLYSAASGFIHGFRYNSQILAKYLAYKNHGIPLSQKELNSDDEFGDYIIKRLSYDSGLFLQQNFVCDVFVPKGDGKFTYYDRLTIPMATQHIFNDLDHYYTVALPVGDTRSNQLNSMDRILLADRAYYSDNSHPVLRRWNKTDCVGEFHFTEALDSKWHDQDKRLILNLLNTSLKVPAEALSRKCDTLEFVVPSPIEGVWSAFHRDYKMQTVPFKAEYILMDDNNALDQSMFYSGKMRGDTKGVQWDLRITKACPVKFVHMIDIMNVGQVTTFEKIRSTLKFTMDGAEKTKITWTTEWLSDLEAGIVEEILNAKQNFKDVFPKASFCGTFNQINRLQPKPETPAWVDELRQKLLQIHPNLHIDGGPHLRIYFREREPGVMVSQKLQAEKFMTRFVGFYGGFYAWVLQPSFVEYKDKLDELSQKLAACF